MDDKEHDDDNDNGDDGDDDNDDNEDDNDNDMFLGSTLPFPMWIMMLRMVNKNNEEWKSPQLIPPLAGCE